MTLDVPLVPNLTIVSPFPGHVVVSVTLAPLVPLVAFSEFGGALTCVPVSLPVADLMKALIFMVSMEVLMSKR